MKPNKQSKMVFRPEDARRVKNLRAKYREGSAVIDTDSDVVRQALRDACILRGLEQRTDVEPMPPGAS